MASTWVCVCGVKVGWGGGGECWEFLDEVFAALSWLRMSYGGKKGGERKAPGKSMRTVLVLRWDKLRRGRNNVFVLRGHG